MGRILVPNREIIRPDATFHMPTTRLGGKFRCQTHKYKSGTLRYDTGWFDNLITDAGIGYIANSPRGGSFGEQVAMWQNCAVGTGSGTPAVGDNSLFTFLTKIGALNESTQGWRNTTGTGYTAASGPTPAFYWGQNQYIFPTGAAAGNLTEIGVFPGGVTYGAGLFSHALIVDGSGNPTSITVLPDEILTVTYQVNFYIDIADHSFSFPLNGVTDTGLYRTMQMGTATGVIPDGGFNTGGSFGEQPVQITMYTGDIGTITGQPSGSVLLSRNNASSTSFVDFVNDMVNTGTWYYDWTGTWPTSTGTGTIKSIALQHTFINYQFGNLATPITKTAGQQLNMSFRASWGRYP